MDVVTVNEGEDTCVDLGVVVGAAGEQADKHESNSIKMANIVLNVLIGSPIIIRPPTKGKPIRQ